MRQIGLINVKLIFLLIRILINLFLLCIFIVVGNIFIELVVLRLIIDNFKTWFSVKPKLKNIHDFLESEFNAV